MLELIPIFFPEFNRFPVDPVVDRDTNRPITALTCARIFEVSPIVCESVLKISRKWQNLRNEDLAHVFNQ
jgi:hypothetical protein